jgi:hypothetical protein
MIHYHGSPITPQTAAIRAFRGRHAFISFWEPRDIHLAAEYCQSFAVDNGAFAAWKSRRPVSDWSPYYAWVDKWRHHPGFDFAVIPDVIDGTEWENDELALEYPFPLHEAAVVWHTNESIGRLKRLCKNYPRVAIGSSGEYDVKSPSNFLARMREVLPHVVDSNGFPITKLHGLRMLNPKIFSKLPLSSADSTNCGRNIGIDDNWTGTYQPACKETRAQVIVERIESINGACRLDVPHIEFDL